MSYVSRRLVILSFWSDYRASALHTTYTRASWGNEQNEYTTTAIVDILSEVCFGSTGGLGGAAELAFRSCKGGDSFVPVVYSGRTGGLSDVAEVRSVVVWMCPGGTGGLCDTAAASLRPCRRGCVVAGVRSGDADGPRGTGEGSLRACSSGRAVPLFTRGSERGSLNCAWDSYETVALGGCVRLDAVFANPGAGGDNDGDMEALG